MNGLVLVWFDPSAAKSKAREYLSRLCCIESWVRVKQTVNQPWDSAFTFWAHSDARHWMSLTLTDALCITITHTQACIRLRVDFYVLVYAGRSSSRWQLNSWAGPPPRPAEAQCLCTLTDGDQTEERRVGTLRVRSGFLVRWKGLSRPFWCDGVSHVLRRSRFLSRWIWIMSAPIFPICTHTHNWYTRGRCCVWFRFLLPSKLHATVLNLSLVTNQGVGGGGSGLSEQLLCKRQEQVNSWRKKQKWG